MVVVKSKPCELFICLPWPTVWQVVANSHIEPMPLETWTELLKLHPLQKM